MVVYNVGGYEEKRLPRHKARLFRFRYRNRRSTGEILFYGYYTPDGGEWSRKIFRQGGREGIRDQQPHGNGAGRRGYCVCGRQYLGIERGSTVQNPKRPDDPPGSVEYDKLGDTDTAAIYDGLSAAQMAQAKKAIRAIAKKLGLNQVDLKNSRIEFPFRFSNANAGVSAQHQSEYGGLYMTVAMIKIKESDVVKKLQAGESAAATSLLSDSNISIQNIFQSVKAGDGRFLKYAPDAFLNDAQKAAKRRAIQRQTEEYASYKVEENGRASVEVENRNTETSEDDARRDFSSAGEPPRVHLAADSFCSITHALMPQKQRLRRNRSAFFCPRQR